MLKTLLIIAILWLIVGHILMWALARKFAPTGGMDAVGKAIFYVMVWKISVWGPPIILASISLFSWLYSNHRWMIKYVILALVLVIVLWKLYNTLGRQILMTPKKNASSIQKYPDWLEDEKNFYSRYGQSRWTEYDYICDYIGQKVVDATVSNIHRIYPRTYQEIRVNYVNTALEETTKAVPHVTGYEYIMDITSIIGKRANSPSYGYLLGNEELLAVAEHYGKRLNTEHALNIYQFGKSAFNNFHSDYPMVALFYDDGTMDLVVTAPVR